MKPYEHPYDRYCRVNKPEPWWQSILWTVVVFALSVAAVIFTWAVSGPGT